MSASAAAGQFGVDLLERHARAHSISVDLCTRSVELVGEARRRIVQAERVTAQAGALRMRFARAENIVGFVLESLVDGRSHSTRWGAGGLECDLDLLAHAEIVVAMNETFVPPSGRAPIPAALDQSPAAALLTLMRASSQVRSVEIEWARKQGS